MTSIPCRRLCIGAVRYLNSKPLIEDLTELAPDAELILDYPSRLSDDLRGGRLDVGLVPSVECLRDPEFEIVSDACVATRGPVLSVKLYSRVLPGEIRSLALDEGSRTSQVLARILLRERYGVEPALVPLPLGNTPEQVPTDAVLVIGDRAMHPPAERFRTIWDLGEEWLAWTGLPFVFALWATRTDADLNGVEEALRAARDRGVARLDQIARREAPLLGIPETLACRYLRENLAFTLGEPERQGLKLFQELAIQAGLAPEGVGIVYRNCPATR